MLNWLKRSLFLLVFAQTTALSAAPVPLVMPPLPPPGWINVTNITPTSATVTWEAVGSGTVWYNTRLEETATGLLVDQTIQTQTTRLYDGLTPGVSYTFKVSVSTSQSGPWGPLALKDFRTTVIVLDDICNLNNDAQIPNQQTPPFQSATTVASNGSYFLCMPKVDLSGTNWSRSDHAFHAYIQPVNTTHFYEFAMIAGTDNGLHFSIDPVKVQGNNMVWTTKFFGANGQEYFIGGPGSQGNPNVPPPIVTVNIYYGPAVPAPADLQLSLSINELTTESSKMTVAVNIPHNNTVRYGENQCILSNTPCPGNSGGGTKGKAALDATTITAESLNDLEKNPDAASAQVQANDQNASSLVSPNPFHSVLQLNLADYSRDLEQVRILNPQGQVMVQLGKNQLNDQVIQIVTDDWIPCMYYLQVLSSSGILSVPVVKM